MSAVTFLLSSLLSGTFRIILSPANTYESVTLHQTYSCCIFLSPFCWLCKIHFIGYVNDFICCKLHLLAMQTSVYWLCEIHFTGYKNSFHQLCKLHFTGYVNIILLVMKTSVEDVNNLTGYVNFILLDKLRITGKENFNLLCTLRFTG